MLNINKRGIQVNPSCPLCNDGMESVVYAILRCKIASNVWRLWDDCPISLMRNNMDIPNLAMEICSKEPKRTWRNFLGWLGGFGTIEIRCFMRQMEPLKLTSGGLLSARLKTSKK